MRLSQLLKNIIDLNLIADPLITHITNDSREVKSGSLFLAYPGLRVDGRHYIPQALQQGAIAILYQANEAHAVNEINAANATPILPVANLQACCGILAARFYNEPSTQLQVIGVTGTNGKTSCTHYLAQVLAKQGQTCAIAGTLGQGFLPDLQENQHTTADAIHLQHYLAEFLAQGAQSVAMEVSSHSLVQHRVSGINFKIAVLTQLTRDHLDYHGDMEAYAAAKARLFAQPNLRMAVLNNDDAFGQTLIQQYKEQLQIVTYSAQGRQHPHLPSVIASHYVQTPTGFNLEIKTPWGAGAVNIPLLGEFNISNVLAVLGVLGLLQIPLAHALTALASVQSVVGRMQLFGGDNKPHVVVDYAHTPDALANVLQTLRRHQPRQLWCVFGCGGDRDRGKRPLMAQVVEQYADHIVITNDNPRTEMPSQIVAEICKGLRNPQQAVIELDRAAAIRYAILQASPGDMVLVAGKGHETVQIIGTERLPFSDQQHVKQVLCSACSAS